MSLRNAFFTRQHECYDIRGAFVLPFPELSTEECVAAFFELLEYELAWHKAMCLSLGD